MMTVSAQLFSQLPDSARLWIFGVSRVLDSDEEARLLSTVDAFLAQWKAHGHPLAAAREWLYGRFLLVGVDDSVEPPSGCSIDALVASLRSLEAELGVEMLGSAPVWYRPAGSEFEIVRVPRDEFRERAREGEVTGETIVFDPSVTRVGELRDGRWERPAGEGWHRSYLS